MTGFCKVLVIFAAIWTSARGNSEHDLSIHEEWITMARCRASCLNKYIDQPALDSSCFEHTDCNVCWQMCGKVRDPVWSPLCNDKRLSVCIGGCETACDFIRTDTMTYISPEYSLWTMPEAPYAHVTSMDQIVVTWSAPERDSSVADDSNIVYVIFRKYDARPHWERISMTANLWVSIDGEHRQYRNLVFNVMAVTPSGIVAGDKAEVIYGVHEDGMINAHVYGDSQPPASAPPRVTLSDHVSVRVIHDDGVIRASVSWLRDERERTGRYTLRWGRSSCRVQQVLPECDLLEVSFIAELENDENQARLSLELPGLTFNSRYWLRLYSEDSGSSERIIFYTPWCDKLGASFTRCLSDAHPDPAVQDPTIQQPTRGPHFPIYLSLVIGFVLAILFIIVTVVLIRSQSQFICLIASKSRSLRDRVYSFRASVRERASAFRVSVNEQSGVNKSRGNAWTPRQRGNIFGVSCEADAPMLPQRILAAQEGRLGTAPPLHRPPPRITNFYCDLADMRMTSCDKPNDAFKPIWKGQRSLPKIPDRIEKVPSSSPSSKRLIGRLDSLA